MYIADNSIILWLFLMPVNVAVCLKLLKYFVTIHKNYTKRSTG